MKSVQEKPADVLVVRQRLFNHSLSFPDAETALDARNHRGNFLLFRRRRFAEFHGIFEEFFASFSGFDGAFFGTIAVSVAVA